MKDEKQPDRADAASNGFEADLERNPEVEEFFKRLMEKQEMRHPKPGPEAIAAALQAIQRLGVASDSAGPAPPTPSADSYSSEGLPICESCGHHNPVANQFCGMCGAPLGPAPESAGAGAGTQKGGVGQHHYHHHYHHHYFAAGHEAELLAAGLSPRVPAAGVEGKDAARLRTPLVGPGVSRAEAAIRQMTQDWAQACNNKQLDDLLAFYATDALVLRPNVPPVRGSAAIREFFVAALDAGLGDIEMEPLRVELAGDVAYQAGRCKMLVPVAVGKRREERGKYVIVMVKQKSGDWKVSVDCWSSDLSLSTAAESMPAKAGPLSAGPKPRRV